MMDAEAAARVPRRSSREKKLLVFLMFLMFLLLLLTGIIIFILWRLQHSASEEDVHLQFGAISDISSNKTLTFQEVSSNHKMELDEETKTKIRVSCTGPYILYLNVCSVRLEAGTRGDLQLWVSGRASPLCSFSLTNQGCQRLHSLVYLWAGEEARLDLVSPGRFKIKNITVGLNSQLGPRCEF